MPRCSQLTLDTPLPRDSPLERALRLQIAAHNETALAFLYDLTQAQLFALARSLLPDDTAAQQVVGQVFGELSDDIGLHDAARFTLLEWLLQRTKSAAQHHLHPHVDAVLPGRTRIRTWTP